MYLYSKNITNQPDAPTGIHTHVTENGSEVTSLWYEKHLEKLYVKIILAFTDDPSILTSYFPLTIFTVRASSCNMG